jgi:CelD/BcsL family acetyltransferase involved in cellulose biosynthesis
MNAPFLHITAAAWTVTTHGSIAELEAIWRALEPEAIATIFQHFDLMRLWYATIAESGEGEPVIAVVREAESGAVAAIFPMIRKRRDMLNWVESADGSVLDYCQPLLAKGLVNERNVGSLVEAVAAAIPGDVLYINRVPERIHSSDNPLATIANRARLPLSTWSFPPGNRESRAEQRKESDYRSRIQRKRRKLAREHKREFHIAVGAELTEEHYALLRDMRVAWFTASETDILLDEHWSEFYRQVILLGDGPVRAYMGWLTADGLPIAVQFGLVDRNSAILLMPASRRDDWGRFSPGLQLMEDVFDHFADGGTPNCDLSIGDSPYKRDMRGTPTPLYDILVPKTLIGKIYYKLWRLKIVARNWLHDRRKARSEAS